MVTYLLKKSYQLKDLKQIEFQDLWGDHGIFTTMWIFGKPAKILFFDSHLKNLILSSKLDGKPFDPGGKRTSRCSLRSEDIKKSAFLFFVSRIFPFWAPISPKDL